MKSGQPWKLSRAENRMVQRVAITLTMAGPYEDGDYIEWVRAQVWGQFVNSENRITRLIACLYRAPSDELMWQAFNFGWDTLFKK